MSDIITIPPWSDKPWATSEKHAIVDMGYTADAEARYDFMRALGVPKSAWKRWMMDRLFCRIPLGKLPKLIAAGAPIECGETYFLTTHHWRGLGAGEDMAFPLTSAGEAK